MQLKNLFPNQTANFSRQVAEYLFQEQTRHEHFIVSADAAALHDAFLSFLKKQKATAKYERSIEKLTERPIDKYQLIRQWLSAFLQDTEQTNRQEAVNEAAVLLLCGGYQKKQLVDASTRLEINGLHGEHSLVQDGTYILDYHQFKAKMAHFETETLPKYQAFQDLKRQLSDDYKKQLRLEEFKPRVLSSFVRNQLIDKVYLPTFGDNFAKQIGTAGDDTRTDRMGLLLLISPPGYGKTTLMEYIADRLGLIFMKINGPAIGHKVTSLDPQDAPNRAAGQELEKLNLSFEMGDNVMIYLDDIQHTSPEFLQKFISLCDAQRKVEGVWKGETKTYDFRGKRVCIVMAGNPYTETGDKFQIPDMLANRADIYNLGDILGDNGDVFKLSYIENSLTSNAALARLAQKSMKDVYELVKSAENGGGERLNLEANHTPGELNEYASVLQKMLRIRDVVLAVNQEYIRSAAMSDDYRTEPAFKLQGSYRNMNKLAEKVVPIMNEKELETLFLAHYEGEAQTLTSGAEANMLKLKELIGMLSAEEQIRWADIKATFVKNQSLRGVGANNPAGQVVAQLDRLVTSVEGMRNVLKGQ